MNTWEQFEKQCTDYLNLKFGDYAKFLLLGGSNSTVVDILAKTNNGNAFYIEVKQSPSQCGQFVLIPNFKTKKFEYSHLNVSHNNKYSQLIIDYMNDNFDEFSDVDSTGKDIIMPNGSDIFANWITHFYKEKDVKFFISNNFIIIPIDNFKYYFYIKAKYRVKRSGSSNVGRENLSNILEFIKSQNYCIKDYRFFNDKIFVYSTNNLHKKKFFYNNNEYMFSDRDGIYEVRKLSNTFNANVIFSIRLIDSVLGLSPYQFIDYLMK